MNDWSICRSAEHAGAGCDKAAKKEDGKVPALVVWFFRRLLFYLISFIPFIHGAGKQLIAFESEA